VTFQVNPPAGLDLDAGVFDVSDSQPADGTGLNEDKLLLRHTRFVKGPPVVTVRSRWALGVILSQESGQNRKSEKKR
jgi:hypothetical protein